ncbi:unnamed protein product, partial [Ectocarpus fasciculatus]
PNSLRRKSAAQEVCTGRIHLVIVVLNNVLHDRQRRYVGRGVPIPCRNVVCYLRHGHRSLAFTKCLGHSANNVFEVVRYPISSIGFRVSFCVGSGSRRCRLHFLVPSGSPLPVLILLLFILLLLILLFHRIPSGRQQQASTFLLFHRIASGKQDAPGFRFFLRLFGGRWRYDDIELFLLHCAGNLRVLTSVRETRSLATMPRWADGLQHTQLHH